MISLKIYINTDFTRFVPEITWVLFVLSKSLNKLKQCKILPWKFSTVPLVKNMTANRLNIEACMAVCANAIRQEISRKLLH